jgi:TrmH family RNA methyltransferase
MNLSRNQLKLITSLQRKKYRVKHKLFIAEGTKVVGEYLSSKYVLEQLFCIDDSAYENIEKRTMISENELKSISSQVNPNNVLAIFQIPPKDEIKNEGFILVLDQINDPGNLGTIMRLCDWFGVDQLICSSDTVDCFNTKAIQASMGSLARLSVVYDDINEFLKNTPLPKFAASMDGKSVYKIELPKKAVLVMGNEANGIADSTFKLIDETIAVPRFGKLKQTESLNVASATAILLSEFKRDF